MRSFSIKSRLSHLLITLMVIIIASCRIQEDPKAQAAAQIARGSPIYKRDCATDLCHGLNGEGLRSGDSFRIWPLVGDKFEARNPNAQVIFDIVRSGSETNLRALSDEDIYAAIAFELTQNGVILPTPINDENAANVLSGAASPETVWGELYPPPGNARLLPPIPAPEEVPIGSNSQLRLRVDQLAKASVIGRSVAPNGGYYLIVVFAMQNLSNGDLVVDPQFILLVDTAGRLHAPAKANLAYPMERFHEISIQPGYGTAGYEIFLIPPGASYDHLLYSAPNSNKMIVNLH